MVKLGMNAQIVLATEDVERRQELRSIAIDALLRDYDEAEKRGNTGYMRYIKSELLRLGFDADYSPTDAGTGYETRED